MTEKLYAERDPEELDKEGGHYCRHLMAMTAEDLHSKRDIASELAYRDKCIAEVTEERNAAQLNYGDAIARVAELEEIIDARYEKHMAVVQRIAELEAARIAYASEFDGDVGNIHQNIRTLKKERDAAFNKGMERAAVIVREHGLFAEEHIRKEIDND